MIWILLIWGAIVLASWPLLKRWVVRWSDRKIQEEHTQRFAEVAIWCVVIMLIIGWAFLMLSWLKYLPS
jgi:hypothetical protein